ncbi:sel1-repeat-containing protein ybeq [Anaeramoeba flamelloides]|uniref:Sel1-repeat-containing protein ybeq n=1 Tax=Anaeramoeba flamelloides TaxID=1746091 RepID=A0ABQ8XIE8_9EUKA|nr:sel1-repeat-containing protein ybeq [Anaeramoeba flamelloides]
MNSFEKYSKRSEITDPEVQMELGFLYFEGIYTNKDRQKAFTLFEQAAQGGSIEGKVYLGECYFLGIETEQNYEKALEFIEPAASLGNSVAVNRLGEMYFFGHHLERNIIKALRYFNYSAEKGNGKGRYNLNNCFKIIEMDKIHHDALANICEKAKKGFPEYQNLYGNLLQFGNGVEKNENEAFKYFKLAAKGGDADGMKNVGLSMLRKYGNLKKDWNKIIKWYKKAIIYGHSGAINNLGIRYSRGEGVQINNQEAKRLFKQSVKKGNGNACNGLANINRRLGNKTKTIKWLIIGHRWGNANSTSSLFQDILNGNVPNSDPNCAFELIKKAAESNNIFAMRRLSNYYYNGTRCPKNYEKSLHWLKQLAKLGDFVSINALSARYMLGKGAEKNFKKSIKYLKIAAKKDEEAQYRLAKLYISGLEGALERDLLKSYQYFILSSEQNHHLLLDFQKKEPFCTFISQKLKSVQEFIQLLKAYSDINLVNIQGRNSKGKDVISIIQDIKSIDYRSYFRTIFNYGFTYDFSLLKDLDKKSKYNFNDENVKISFFTESSIYCDFLTVFEKGGLVDCEIKGIQISKFWVEYRTGLTIDFLTKELQDYTKEETIIFLKFIYSNFVFDFEVLKKMLIKVNLTKMLKDNFFRKQLKKLYNEDETKDFMIIVEEEAIKVHKFVIYTRSLLYQRLLDDVKVLENKVHNYSNISIDSFEVFIKFLYYDWILPDADNNIEQLIEDFEDVIYYYRLNTYTPFYGFLVLLKNMQEKNISFLNEKKN